MKKSIDTRSHAGSIELVILGLLAALLVVLAIPLLTGFEDQQTPQTLPTTTNSVGPNQDVSPDDR